MEFIIKIIKDHNDKDITNERNTKEDYYSDWEKAGNKILNSGKYPESTDTAALFFKMGSLLIVSDKSGSIIGLKYLKSLIHDSKHITIHCQIVHVGAPG